MQNDLYQTDRQIDRQIDYYIDTLVEANKKAACCSNGIDTRKRDSHVLELFQQSVNYDIMMNLKTCKPNCFFKSILVVLSVPQPLSLQKVCKSINNLKLFEGTYYGQTSTVQQNECSCGCLHDPFIKQLAVLSSKKDFNCFTAGEMI